MMTGLSLDVSLDENGSKPLETPPMNLDTIHPLLTHFFVDVVGFRHENPVTFFKFLGRLKIVSKNPNWRVILDKGLSKWTIKANRQIDLIDDELIQGIEFHKSTKKITLKLLFETFSKKARSHKNSYLLLNQRLVRNNEIDEYAGDALAAFSKLRTLDLKKTNSQPSLAISELFHR